MPEFLRFQSNVIEPIALQTLQGVAKDGVFGPQKLFRLTDGRGMYLNLDVASRVEALTTRGDLQLGQVFWMCKHRTSKGRKEIWDIYLKDPTPHEGESTLVRDLRLSIDKAQQDRTSREAEPVPAPVISMPEPSAGSSTAAETRMTLAKEAAHKPQVWSETLLHQTNELTDAYASALQHAGRHGLAVKPEDVRTLLVTAFINLSQRKGRSVA
jgi:hypothetical protein